VTGNPVEHGLWAGVCVCVCVCVTVWTTPHIIALMMGPDMVSEIMSIIFNKLTRLIAHEDIVSRHESFTLYKAKMCSQ